MASRTTADFKKAFDAYVAGVSDGSIVACKFIKQSIKRHIKDTTRTDHNFVFDWEKAARPCRFIELLPHVKGAWATRKELIKLEPWQIFIVASLFGWVDKTTGFRRFRVAYIEVPRKNAKSALAAGIGLYMLAADKEEGAEVYSAATHRKQALAVYDTAQGMVKKTPALRQGLGLAVNSIQIFKASNFSKFQALAKAKSKGGGNLDGLNISCAIVDELHAHPDSSMWDVLGSGIGARNQPLIFAITTAGSDLAGVCYEQRVYLSKVLNNTFHDDSFFGMIYTIDDQDDPFEPSSWPKANPNWRVSVMPESVENAARKAKQQASSRAEFLKKHLNVWTNSDQQLFDTKLVLDCADPLLKLEDVMKDSIASIGCDLASKDDFASLAMVCKRNVEGKDHYYAFCKHYTNEEAVKRNPAPMIKTWAESGYMNIASGQVNEHDDIKTGIEEFLEQGAREVAFDPAQAWATSQALDRAGITVVEYRMNVRSLSDPTKELAALIKSGRFHYDGDPVLAWMLSNVVGHYDAKDQVFPKREIQHAKIDGAIAVIIGIGRLLSEDTYVPSFTIY